MKVFLGGTCNESKWREALIPLLKIDYFNPVVEDWTPECQEEERKQRAECDFVLYVIAPLMMGVYSIAEVIDDSNKRPEKTIFCLLESDFSQDPMYLRGMEHKVEFTKGQLKSLRQVFEMVNRNGGISFNGLDEVAKYINWKVTK